MWSYFQLITVILFIVSVIYTATFIERMRIQVRLNVIASKIIRWMQYISCHPCLISLSCSIRHKQQTGLPNSDLSFVSNWSWFLILQISRFFFTPFLYWFFFFFSYPSDQRNFICGSLWRHFLIYPLVCIVRAFSICFVCHPQNNVSQRKVHIM